MGYAEDSNTRVKAKAWKAFQDKNALESMGFSLKALRHRHSLVEHVAGGFVARFPLATEFSHFTVFILAR